MPKLKLRANANRNQDPEKKANSGFQLYFDRLTYGPRTNYYGWDKQAIDYLMVNFGRNAKQFETGIPRVFPQVPIPRLFNAISSKRYANEVEARRRDMQQYKDDCVQMIAILKAHLSQESISRLQNHRSYQRYNNADNALGIWNLIKLVHNSPGTGFATGDIVQLNLQISTIAQKPNEPIETYKMRFEGLVNQANNLANGMNYTVDVQVVMFIDGLNNSYAAFKANNAELRLNNPGAMPADLAAACTAALNYNETMENYLNTSGPPVAKSRQIIGYHQRRLLKGQEEPAADDTPDQDAQSAGCLLCKKTNHPTEKCFSLAKCQAFLDSEKSKKKAGKRKIDDVKPSSSSVNKKGKRYLLFPTVVTALNASQKQMNYKLEKFDVILDNGATDTVVKDIELIYDLRDEQDSVTIGGIAGGAIETNRTGVLPQIGRAWYHPDAMANIVAQSILEKKSTVKYDPGKSYTFESGKDPLTFEFKTFDSETGSGLYVRRFAPLRGKPSEKLVAVATVAENKLKFTKRQVRDAEKALELRKRLGFPSSRAMIEMYQNGGIADTSVTIHDILRADKIFGPSIAEVQGKSVNKKTPHVDTEIVPRPLNRDQTLHVDIFFVDKEPFLLTKSTPLTLLMITHIKSRKKKDIESALILIINDYSAHGFKITIILCDREGAVAACEQMFQSRGIIFNPADAEKHVPTIERAIRVVRDRSRSVIRDLPYNLPKFLIPSLLKFVAIMINSLPNSNSNISPRELYTGRKLSEKLDLRISFGEFVQIRAPRKRGKKDNDIREPRTVGAIALYSKQNLQGSVLFYILSSGYIVSRDHFTKIPMPEDLVNQMNQLATQNQLAELVIEYPNETVEEIAEESDNLNDLQPPERVEVDLTEENQLIEGVDGEELLIEESEEALPEPIHPSDFNLVEQEDQIELAQPDLVQTDLFQPDLTEPDSIQPLEDQPPEIPIIQEAVHAPGKKKLKKLRFQTPSSPPPPAQHDHFLRRNPKKQNRLSLLAPSRQAVRERLLLHVSVKESMRKRTKETVEAVKKELRQMLDMKVWHPVIKNDLSKTQRKKIIRSFMFMKEKFLANGAFDKLKARLVAGGNQQDIDYEESLNYSSPTASLQAVFLVAAIAAKEGRHVATMDIPGAYLNAEMTNEVFLQLDTDTSQILKALDPSYEKFAQVDGSVIVQLDKALYGCVESAKLWYDLFSRILIELGFKVNRLEPCVFNKTVNGEQITICLYVDDLMITCKDKTVLDEVIKSLQDKFGAKANVGTVHSYLGMSFNFEKQGEVSITMEGYTDELLNFAGIKGTVKTPATENLFTNDDSKPLTDIKRKLFHTLVAKLMYLAKRARPDILTAVAFLSTRVSCPNQLDWQKLERIFKYLNHDSTSGICLKPGSGDIQINAYADASYGVHADGKSHSGLCIALGQGPVFVRSAKQKIVSKSSTEAELISVSDGCSQIIWSRDFLIEQGYQMGPAKVYQDNQSTIRLVKNGKSSSERTRHVNIRYFFIKDRVDSGELEVEYCPTNEMHADILTKPLHGEQFIKLKQRLLNWSYDF